MGKQLINNGYSMVRGVSIGFEIYLASQSIADNTSHLEWALTLEVYDDNATWQNYKDTTWTVDIDGNHYEGTLKQMAYGSSKMMGWGEFDSVHNKDGTKTISFSFTHECNGRVYGMDVDKDFDKIVSGSGTVDLPLIPHVSTASCATSYIGSEAAINISASSSTLTHTLTYSFEGLTGTIAEKASGSTVKWIIPTTFYKKLTNSKTGVCTLSCTTYSGNTFVGTTQSTFKVQVPDTVVPLLSPTVEDVNEITLALTGDKNKFIRYYSDAAFTINAVGVQGATIASQFVRNGGKTVEGASGVVYGIENGTFGFGAIDSRGMGNSVVIDVPTINYVKLTCNIEGQPDTDGNYDFTLEGNYFAGSFGVVTNTLKVEYRYKSNDGEFGAWTALSPVLSNNNTYTASTRITGLDYRATYIFQARVADKLMTTTTPETKVKALPIFDWSESDFNFNVPITYTEDGTVYEVSEAVKGLHGLDVDSISQIAGIVKAMTNRYELPCEISVGPNYSGVECNLYLYGNTIRGYLHATRKTAAEAGNVANEYVCQIDFNSDLKVSGFGMVSFCSGGTGGVATFNMQDSIIYPDDGSVDETQVGKGAFKIYLAATATSASEWSCYFTFPCLIDLTKY